MAKILSAQPLSLAGWHSPGAHEPRGLAEGNCPAELSSGRASLASCGRTSPPDSPAVQIGYGSLKWLIPQGTDSPKQTHKERQSNIETITHT